VHVAVDGVGVDARHVVHGVAVRHAVGEQHVVECLAAVLGLLVEQFGGPDFLHGEALGEFQVLPEVGTRLAGRLDLLAPELGAAFGIAVGAFFLDPHGGGQDQVGRQGGYGRIRVGYHDEGGGVAPAGVDFIVDVGPGLHVVGGGGPVALELAVLQGAALRHGVQADLGRDGAVRQLP